MTLATTLVKFSTTLPHYSDFATTLNYDPLTFVRPLFTTHWLWLLDATTSVGWPNSPMSSKIYIWSNECLRKENYFSVRWAFGPLGILLIVDQLAKWLVRSIWCLRKENYILVWWAFGLFSISPARHFVGWPTIRWAVRNLWLGIQNTGEFCLFSVGWAVCPLSHWEEFEIFFRSVVKVEILFLSVNHSITWTHTFSAFIIILRTDHLCHRTEHVSLREISYVYMLIWQ